VVFFLRCGCKLLAGDMVFYSPVFKCSTTENITALFTPSFTVNLAFLTEFFEVNSLQEIAADHLLNEDIEVDLPKLSIATKQYDAKLAQGQELKYDMSILINQTKTDSKMYDDLSHFLYNQMILNSLEGLDGKHFNVFNVSHWVILFIGIAAAAALVWLFIFHNKYRSLMILLAAQSRATAQIIRTPMPKLLQFGRSPPTTPNDEQMKTIRDYLADIFPTEVLLMVILLAILLFMISVFVYKLLEKYKNDHTKLTLRLTSDRISFKCPVGYLRYGCDHYTFSIRVAVAEISLFEYFIFGHLIWGNGLTIKDALIGDPVHISKFVRIYSWQARKLRNILQAGDNYSAVLLLTEPNKVIQIICLKQRTGPTSAETGNAILSASVPSINAGENQGKLPLYPNLSS